MPWIRAARFHLFTVAFTFLLLGSVIAWYEHGVFSWQRFILSFLISLSIHLITSFVNDVADVHTDEVNLFRSPFSGGSGVLVEGLLSSKDLIMGASLAGLLAIFLTGCLIFSMQVHWGILVFVGWGILSATEYSLPPAKLSYRGVGELLVLVTYSAVIWGGYFVQAGPSHSFMVWGLTVPAGLAAFSLITVAQFPDAEADREAGKRSFVIIFGAKLTMRIISLAVFLSIIVVISSLLMGFVPITAGAFSLLCLPLVYRLTKMMLDPEGKGTALYVRIMKSLLILTLWFSLAPIPGLMLNKWLR